jgi:coniferyl-aldehyde dehydrogenase
MRVRRADVITRLETMMSIIEHDLTEHTEDTNEIARLRGLVSLQKSAFLADPYPSLKTRSERINALVGAVMAHRDEIKDSMTRDFGWHPGSLVDLIEVLGVGARAGYVLSHLEEWMSAEERDIDSNMWGNASAQIRWRPKGVVGNMVPWNFPFDIAFGPLIDMLAAGNRVIIKPSDYSVTGGEVIRAVVESVFDEDLVAVVTGGIELARTFPTMKWDHLMYTGSPNVGRQVMRAAAENLVPVTLELGGKNPVIVAADAVNEVTVSQLIGMKLLKSGQVCTAPDHVFVPRAQLDQFVSLVQEHVQANLPDFTASVDATGIISERHLDRLLGMVEQARDAGYRIVQPDEEGVVDRQTRRMPFAMVIEPGSELDVMREEIFGPVLSVLVYDEIDEVIASVNAGERPLGLYVYTADPEFSERILNETSSGGACVNLCLLQGALSPLAFGGVGNSGMGRHHGVEGFREFSYPRGVFSRGTEADVVDLVNPPYRQLESLIESVFASMETPPS